MAKLAVKGILKKPLIHIQTTKQEMVPRLRMSERANHRGEIQEELGQVDISFPATEDNTPIQGNMLSDLTLDTDTVGIIDNLSSLEEAKRTISHQDNAGKTGDQLVHVCSPIQIERPLSIVGLI